MGTWCTEGVKRIQAEHRRQESDELQRQADQRLREKKDNAEEEGVCYACGKKLKS
ncbi:hypothetical protein LCGC14_0536230 [marine sediment metagenome]|uniref:Uncharacterized protein n=1 Tax=marine sediment metagenome TaxID=412755 RepID=A0A0F9UFM9_9ZZZZ